MQIEDMDFKGKWTTRCGLIAIVEMKFGVIGWSGYIEVPPIHKIPTQWNLRGLSKDKNYDLIERRLEGEGL